MYGYLHLPIFKFLFLHTTNMNNKVLVCFLVLVVGILIISFAQYNTGIFSDDYYNFLRSTTTEHILVKQNNGKKKTEDNTDNKQGILFKKRMADNVEKLTSVVQQLLQNVPFASMVTTAKKNSTDHKTHTESELNVKACPKKFSSWYVKTDKFKKEISNDDELATYNKLYCKKDDAGQCLEKPLVGPLAVHETNYSWLYDYETEKVEGWWSPSDCKPKQHTVVIIPYRDREHHLSVLLHHLHPILQRHNIHYRILVVEQNDNNPFNRAKLMNIGYEEALRYFPYQCLIFHDVDLIPEDDRIDYSCKLSPQHLSVAVSTLKYELPYPEIFGGVSALLSEHFQKFNGFSNSFWEWGGEDDNLSHRLSYYGFEIHRQSAQIARFKMLSHTSRMPVGENPRIKQFLHSSYNFIKQDGLNSLQYEIVSRHKYPLYALVKVNLRKEKDTLYKEIEDKMK